jgi:aryl-alcohol dehydrogenase-like predicted oxidoreductase
MLDKMVIGTVQFGLDYGVNMATAKKMDQQKCDEILDMARANDITKLDTAEIYGDSIDKIGDYHKRNPKFEILSKFHTSENVYNTLTGSLKRLSIPGYHTILAHRSHDLLSNDTVSNDLRNLKDAGLTKYIGVSIYTNEEFEHAIESKYVDVIQFPFNLLDNINQRGKWMKRAKDAGKILHARSVYLQGMLLKPFPLPDKLRTLEVYLQKLQDLCTDSEISMTALCLEYVFSNHLIDNVVIGQHSASQLAANIDLIRNFKNGEYLKEVDDIIVKEAELLSPRNW